VPILVAVLALAACGGNEKTPAERVADCLNAEAFLVQADGARVEGTSPAGIAFSVAVRSGRIDDAGNPARRRLARRDRSAIERCLERR
jgi:hypothetical protein